ncbi:MAG: protoporphyrinogen oxidase [Candidatus Nanopelagicales bacterium]
MIAGDADVLVIGAGITGLAAAWELGSAGREVVVLEADARAGGKVHTETRDGFRIEHGPDSVITYRPAALALIRELGLGEQIVSVTEPRSVSLRVAGRMRPMPAGMGLVLPTQLGPFVTTKVLTWPQKIRAAADLVLPRVLGEADMAIGTLLRRRLGDGVVAGFVDPLLGGVYGASVDELSVDAVVPTLRTSEAEHRSLMLASLAQGRAARRAGSTGGSPFRSLRAGMGSLVDALVEALTAQGVSIRFGASVASLELLDGSGVRVTLADGSTLSAGSVLLACGVRATADLVGPFAAQAAAELSAIPLGSTSSVSLGFDAASFPVPLVGHGYLEAGPDRPPISGITISSNKWADRAPEGSVLVRAFVPDRVGPLASAPDDQVLATVTSYASAILGATGAPTMRHLVRWPGAMPKYVVGHRDRVARIESTLAGPVRVAGSALNGVGLPDCVSDGRRVAGQLIAG